MKWLSMTRSKKGEKRGKYPKSGHHLQGFNVPVYLNVYEISHLNTYFHWTGIGIFHSGVEVYGVEYGFGAHDWQTSGVFEVEPRRCPRFKFRKSIFMGMINKNPIQVHEFFENQSHDYKGNAYHLILKNCNHFTTDICHKLRVRPVPKWVNRLARIGNSDLVFTMRVHSFVPSCSGYVQLHIARRFEGSEFKNAQGSNTKKVAMFAQ